MAKKKAAKKVAVKRAKTVAKAKRITKARGAKASGKKAPRKKAGGKSKAAPAKRRVKRISLGRPKVTAEEKLYMLFKDDYHARQIFEFLRVETVGELEHYSPEQIVDRLSAPIVITVQRIRRQLASLNRSLAGDEAFAAEHKQSASR